MSDEQSTGDDPAVVGVPPGTPEDVKPSVTGLVKGPLDAEPEVEIAEIHGEQPGS